ncbi:MAG: porin [Candidatus Latescibacterota bacterium]
MKRVAVLLAALCAAASATFAADRPAVQGGVYDKPYLRQTTGGTTVGGYIDHELFWNDKAKTFDQHRFIPFLFSEVSDRIYVAAEIEFEHGGNVGGDGEIKLEFATLDIAFHEAVSLRGGVILSPLGRFNLIHDSPLNDLTNRPLMAREIVPTTLSESGMGLFGTFYPSEAAVMGYELYVVNGFDEAAATRLRSGRGSQKLDNNEEKSIVGRLNYSPSLGLDLGGSFHVGAYDDSGEDNLSIFAVDASWNRGPLDMRGEYATASIDGADEDSRSGYYAQVAYHFLPGSLSFPNSTFTVAARYDHIDLGASDETRTTVGLNFRPEEGTVIKLDYEIYDRDDDSNGLILSLASYF